MIMKKIFALIVASVAIIVLAASCNKAQQTPSQPEEAGQITIRAFMPEGTKVAFSEADNDGLHLAWEEGDYLIISNGSQSQTFEIKEGFTDHEAEFTGTAITGESFTILYTNGDWESVAGAQGFDFTSQVQNGNGNTDHLRYVAWLSGVNAYTEFTFSQAWATEHGGTFNVPGIIKLEATLPEEATKLKSATLNIAGTEFTLGLKNVDVSTSAQVLTAYAMIPWSGLNLPAKTPVDLVITGEDDSDYGISFTLPSGADLKPGHVSALKFPKGIVPIIFAGGSGTEADPYLIAKAKQLDNMHGALVDGSKVYFKLIADIDASSITNWQAINAPSPYTCEVDFDGDNHTISNFKCSNQSYAGFFGVLNGSCKNVKFVNAEITQNQNSACGIIAGYAGSGDIHAEISHVQVQGKVTFSGNKTGIGGLVGTVANANIDACSADCIVYSGKNYVGGLFGFSKTTKGGNHFSNCWTSGSVRGDQRVGGIAGGMFGDGDTMTNCYSTAILDGTGDYAATRSVGGIVGHANQDKGDGNETRMPGNVIQGCIAWQDAIKTRYYLGATTTNSESGKVEDYYSSGAILAYGATHNTYANCYRKASLDFRDYADSFPLYDQENSSPESPLVITAVDGCTHCYPYHGKAAAAGATLTQVAQGLGWSADVWDFSGAVPTLK